MKTSELFALCQTSDSLAVADVHGEACDNAAATLGARFVQGAFDEEFLANWFGSLQTVLSGEVIPEARQFFDAHGVAY